MMKQKSIDTLNNRELCALDMSHATEEQTRAWLRQIIDNELSRGDAADEALILECMEQMEQLAGDTAMSAEKCRAHLSAFLNTVSKPTASSTTFRAASRRPWVRLGIAAAMLIMMLVCTPTIHAYAQVYSDNKLYHEAIDRASPDTPTVTVPEETVYNDMASFIRDHGDLDFFYPHFLKEGEEIRSIRMTYQSAQSWIAIFHFSNPDIKHFTVQQLSQPSHMIEQPQGEKIFPTGTQNYVLSQSEKDGVTLYHAECITDGIRYTVEASSYNALRYYLAMTFRAYDTFDDIQDLLQTHDYLQSFRYPADIPIRSSLSYGGSLDWAVHMYFETKAVGGSQTITVYPVRKSTVFDPGDTPIILSNENVDIYLLSQASAKNDVKAVCVTDGMLYKMEINGYDQFLAIAESMFGPF